MEYGHVPTGLIRKRAEIAGELEALQARVADTFASLEGLDTAIRLFAPDAELDGIAPRRPLVRLAALPGQTSRVIADALREAPEPLTTQALTVLVMASRGLDAEDRALFLTMQKRVLASLRNLRMRGAVQSDKRGGSNMSWKLA